MSTWDDLKPQSLIATSWYDVFAEQLQVLIPRFGIERSMARLNRACEFICKESLNLEPGTQTGRTSRLNHDGTPIQFALTLGRQPSPLQFLSEVGQPDLSYSETREFVEARVRILSELLQLQGDADAVIELIRRSSAINPHACDPNLGGICWMGASFAAGEKWGLKIYMNGKNGTENERWVRLDDFAAWFGASEKLPELKQVLKGKMMPMGMGIALHHDEGPTGRIYLSGYGNRLSYYEDLLRHFDGDHPLDAFARYTEVMLEENCAYPTQSVVFSAGFRHNKDEPNDRIDLKIEFCSHCLFTSDLQARERTLRWLELRHIDANSYEDLLDAIAGEISSKVVNTHMYAGLGWKEQQEYTTLYLKPNPVQPRIIYDL